MLGMVKGEVHYKLSSRHNQASGVIQGIARRYLDDINPGGDVLLHMLVIVYSLISILK